MGTSNERGCDINDRYIKTYQLQGEGRWFEAEVFIDVEGNEYEIWYDQDGDSKIVE